ncbi:hypothetical protein HRG_013041 [Hirsutella rhossiliensis]
MRYTISSPHGQKATSLACQDHTALVASTSPGGNYVSHKYSWMIASEEVGLGGCSPQEFLMQTNSRDSVYAAS